jgi:hypothetical protein
MAHRLPHHLWGQLDDLALAVHVGAVLGKDAEGAVRGEVHADMLQDMQRSGLDIRDFRSAKHVQVEARPDGLNLYRCVLKTSHG